MRCARPSAVASGSGVSTRFVPVAAPYRLDLTVAVLRRFSTNIVDVVAPDGTYARVLAGSHTPVLVTVRQFEPAALVVEANGEPGDDERAFALAHRMLGVDRTTAGFDAGARRIPWLRALARRMRGVKPPRYPTLWEACVNAIVFQQISLLAASSILRRTIVALGSPREYAGLALHAFPTIDTVAGAPDASLREAGLSAGKVATLRRIAESLGSGALDEAMLEERPSPAAAALLCTIKGIGPWTAAVILLRGLGRLDVFPANDSGVARGLAALAGADVEVAPALETLGSERGMLYYHLLLARLEARGEI